MAERFKESGATCEEWSCASEVDFRRVMWPSWSASCPSAELDVILRSNLCAETRSPFDTAGAAQRARSAARDQGFALPFNLSHAFLRFTSLSSASRSSVSFTSTQYATPSLCSSPSSSSPTAETALVAGKAQAGRDGRLAARTGGREWERARERDSSCGVRGQLRAEDGLGTSRVETAGEDYRLHSTKHHCPAC